MRLIAIFISLTVAVIFFFFLMNYLGDKKTVVEHSVVVEKPVEVVVPEKTKKVVIAARYIAPGTVLDPSMLDAQDWPERLIVDQFLVAGSPQANVIGMVARSPFQPREPLVLSKIAKQGDPSFIAATLPDGQRMVTIQTDGIRGVAGFVYPGDRVDVLLTHLVEIPTQATPQNPSAQPKQEEITEPLLVNVPVIAVDQRAVSEASEKQVLPTSVSLQVTPEDAQKLRLSEKRGTMSLALRPIKDKDQNMISPTTRFDITHFYVTDPAKAGDKNPLAAAMPGAATLTVTIVRGVKSENVQIDAPSAAPSPAAASSSSAAPSSGPSASAPQASAAPAANSSAPVSSAPVSSAPASAASSSSSAPSPSSSAPSSGPAPSTSQAAAPQAQSAQPAPSQAAAAQ